MGHFTAKKIGHYMKGIMNSTLHSHFSVVYYTYSTFPELIVSYERGTSLHMPFEGAEK